MGLESIVKGGAVDECVDISILQTKPVNEDKYTSSRPRIVTLLQRRIVSQRVKADQSYMCKLQ